MAIQRIQQGTVQSGSGGNITCTPGASNVAIGDVLLLAVIWDGNDGVSPIPGATVDGLGNVFTLYKSYINTLPPTTLTSIAIYLAPVTVAGASSTVVNMQGCRGGAVVLEYKFDNATSLDQFAEITASLGTSLTTPSTPPTSTASQLLFAVGATLGAGASTLSAGSGYTMQTQGGTGVAGQMGVMDQIVSSTGTYAATMTGFTSGGFNSLLLITIQDPPPTHSISGNAGAAAGATVTLGGAASATTTADGSGNYSFGTLVDGTYTITPSKTGFFFFPNTMTRALAGADITNGIFGSANNANTYTQRAYDSFQRADENPLNPTNWTVGTGFQPLEIISKVCLASTDSLDCAELFTNATWPANGQYVQMQFPAFTAGLAFILFYSSLDETVGYFILLQLSGGHVAYQIFLNDGTIILTGTVASAFTPSDVMRVEKVASQIVFYYNNVSIGSVANSGASTGYPGIDLNVASALDIQVIDFVAGSVQAPTFSISGNVGIAGVTVSLTGDASQSTTSDGSGNYSFSGVLNGNYVVTPTKTGYTFAPTSHSETVSGGNLTGVNFVATQQSGDGFAMDFNFNF